MTNRYIRTYSKKRIFNIVKGQIEIETLVDRLPTKNEVYKFFSLGGFSSICFIRFVAMRATIKELTVSTLRVGKKELKTLDMLYLGKRLEKCNLIIGSIVKNDSKLGKSYEYYKRLKEICDKNNWDHGIAHNHSKILLFDTDKGKFVIETSSNLNENPKCEQFSFEQSEELYDMYYDVLIDLMDRGRDDAEAAKSKQG